jgi:hypothetical protein
MTNGNGPTGHISMKIEAPKECCNCKAVLKMIEEHQDGWTILRFDQMGLFFFICPFCHAVTVNSNHAQTVQWANNQRNQRVKPVRSPLIVPH